MEDRVLGDTPVAFGQTIGDDSKSSYIGLSYSRRSPKTKNCSRDGVPRLARVRSNSNGDVCSRESSEYRRPHAFISPGTGGLESWTPKKPLTLRDASRIPIRLRRCKSSQYQSHSAAATTSRLAVSWSEIRGPVLVVVELSVCLPTGEGASSGYDPWCGASVWAVTPARSLTRSSRISEMRSHEPSRVVSS